ncbi:hypothetical protein FPQ18DRAFT_253487 [Pyronema domesticum]|uniref:Uncharacterized protein n=1 Tax=Pyronema omphalodes (strain CBS 100304) TaxID=1076935 RepID=U4L5K6_PYROM|nr:hypothetical protein FPQ18DRAFT_253487 [Pyronema domesticum]CCX12322.1 Similar to hypothetical protein [Tuber melanosporum Mel28]; acc. no. XP_002838841 [Pyronema omphalodes CBS 100304]
MSAIIRTPVARQLLAASKTRSIGAATTVRFIGSTRHENDPDVLQKGKESVLRKHSKSSAEEPKWHEELATDAEAFVKAERGEIDAKESIEKLQRETKDKASEKR